MDKLELLYEWKMENGKQSSHIELLRREFDKRISKNSRYSLRAFAFFLEVHPSALSRILSGKQELSIRSCSAIFSKIELSEDERRSFIESVIKDKTYRLKQALTLAAGLHDEKRHLVANRSFELVDNGFDSVQQSINHVVQCKEVIVFGRVK